MDVHSILNHLQLHLGSFQLYHIPVIQSFIKLYHAYVIHHKAESVLEDDSSVMDFRLLSFMTPSLVNSIDPNELFADLTS